MMGPFRLCTVQPSMLMPSPSGNGAPPAACRAAAEPHQHIVSLDQSYAMGSVKHVVKHTCNVQCPSLESYGPTWRSPHVQSQADQNPWLLLLLLASSHQERSRDLSAVGTRPLTQICSFCLSDHPVCRLFSLISQPEMLDINLFRAGERDVWHP